MSVNPQVIAAVLPLVLAWLDNRGKRGKRGRKGRRRGK